jgi:hypothetical protein
MKSTSPLASTLKPEDTLRPRNSYPKTLSSFCNAQVLGIYKCTACSWPHYGISERDALHYVTLMNEYTASLDEQEAMDIFGGKCLSLDHFRRCFFCSSATGEMTLSENSDNGFSVSGRPIIVPPRA